MLNLKYIESFIPAIAKATVGQYSTLESDAKESVLAWDSWRKRHGVLNDDELPSDSSAHIKVYGAADRCAGCAERLSAGFLQVPRDFAEKAIVLGFFPD